jgi:hypothetical protein
MTRLEAVINPPVARVSVPTIESALTADIRRRGLRSSVVCFLIVCWFEVVMGVGPRSVLVWMNANRTVKAP